MNSNMQNTIFKLYKHVVVIKRPCCNVHVIKLVNTGNTCRYGRADLTLARVISGQLTRLTRQAKRGSGTDMLSSTLTCLGVKAKRAQSQARVSARLLERSNKSTAEEMTVTHVRVRPHEHSPDIFPSHIQISPLRNSDCLINLP